MITFDEYQDAAINTAIYPKDWKIVYPAIGLSGECGEIMEKIKKTIRDNAGHFDNDRIEAIALEIGDVLWYCANLAQDIGIPLSMIAKLNLGKIYDRKKRNVLNGEGDNR